MRVNGLGVLDFGQTASAGSNWPGKTHLAIAVDPAVIRDGPRIVVAIGGTCLTKQ